MKVILYSPQYFTISLNSISLIGCSFNDVINVILGSSVSHLFLREWKTLARQLEIPYDSIRRHEINIKLNSNNFPGVLRDVLCEWRSRESKRATLGILVDVLRQLQWNSFAGLLLNFYTTHTFG